MRSTSALVFSILRIRLDSILRLGLCACMGVPCKDGEIARGGLIPCLTDPPSMSHRRSISKRKKKEEKNETEKAQGGGKGGWKKSYFAALWSCAVRQRPACHGKQEQTLFRHQQNEQDSHIWRLDPVLKRTNAGTG